MLECLVIAVKRLLWSWICLISSTGLLTVRCDIASDRIKRATLQKSTWAPILNKTLPRHQLGVRLALRKLGQLPKSPLIPVRPQTLHPQLQLQQQLLILSSTSSILSSTTSPIIGSLQFMRAIRHHYLASFTLELYLCLRLDSFMSVKFEFYDLDGFNSEDAQVSPQMLRRGRWRRLIWLLYIRVL